MARISHLKALQALEAALRHGSLKAAAAELAITPAAAGQRIKSLEDYLGHPLLARDSHELRPSPQLKQALPHLAQAFAALNQAAERLGLQHGNAVTVMADADWAELWLAPRLARFAALQPHIAVAVNSKPQSKQSRGGADFAIAFAKAGHGATELLFRDYLLPVSSPANAERVLALPPATRLEGFPLLHVGCYAEDAEALTWPAWVGRFGFRKGDASRGVQYRRLSHGLDAVRSDAGLLICGLALVMDAIGSGTLSVPFGFERGAWTGYGYRLAASAKALQRPPCRKFHAWLLSECQETRAALVLTSRTPAPPG